MDELGFEALEFMLGRCAVCDREVLTYPDPDGDELNPRRCVHCDQAVSHLRSAKGDDLPANGYGLLETQGCGNPACGGGQCSRRQNEH